MLLLPVSLENEDVTTGVVFFLLAWFLGSVPSTIRQNMAAHVCPLSTVEDKDGRSKIQGQPKLQGKIKASLGYTRPCFK